MWNNPTATRIVLGAIRKFTDIIRNDLVNYVENPQRTEELDEAVRLTRTVRSATTLIASFALNRLAAQMEELLDSFVEYSEDAQAEALLVVGSMLDAFDSHAQRSEVGEPSPDGRREFEVAIRAFRRFRGLSEEHDGQAIASLFETPVFAAQPEGPPPSGGAVSHDGSPAATGQNLASDMQRRDDIPAELWEVFQQEAQDHIDSIYESLKGLNDQPSNRDLLQQVRRSAHTLKGAAGAVGLEGVMRLSHRMEDLLDALYEGNKSLDAELLKLLARTTDLLQDLFAGETDASHAQVLGELYAAYDARCASPTAADPSHGQQASSPATPAAAINQPAMAEAPKPRPNSFLRVPLERLDGLRRVASELIVNRTSMEQTLGRMQAKLNELRPALEMIRQAGRDLERYREASTWQPAWNDADSVELTSSLPDLAGLPTRDVRGAGVTELNPCETGTFDELEFDRFTDLDLCTQSLSEVATTLASADHEMGSLMDDCDTLLVQQSRLTWETQDRVFELQMVPVNTITPRLQRALRETADHENKAVQLVIEGDDVELDKTVLEAMVEPLMHLLRNAVDHGIETAGERQAAGKSDQATVRLRFSHFGTQVVIEVNDDGRGLDGPKILAKAIERGIVSREEGNRLPPQEMHRFIFSPGFSTADSVSQISGRGVGMDIVLSKIESLKGRIDVTTVANQGSSFTIRLPVSLAVARALMLEAQHELFAIPQRAVHAVMRVDELSITQDGERPLIEHDGKSYPLVRLWEYLGLETDSQQEGDHALVAIVGSPSRQVALQVDEVLPGRDIIVQPLDNQIAAASGLLGATILGDGQVVPILDPTDLLDCTAPNKPVGPNLSLLPVPKPSSRRKTVTVMIVEDSMCVRRVVQNVVEKSGWKAVAARDGVDALEKLVGLEIPPDIFLLDVEMPRMDGFELLGNLRSEAAFAHTPIVMITSRTGSKHREQANELGATAYLSKPFQEKILVETIRQLVQ